MSLQTAPVTLTPLSTELATPLLPSTAFNVCFGVFLVSQLSGKPVLPLHHTSQTLIASKPGLKRFPRGLKLYLSETNTGGEAANSRIISRAKTYTVQSPACGAWCVGFHQDPSLSCGVAGGPDLPCSLLAGVYLKCPHCWWSANRVIAF